MTNVQTLDVLFAFKALTVIPKLSSSARAVGGAIIAHFNRRNGQCDPSIDRLCILLGLGRSTVLRALDELQSLELIERNVHGSKFNRNAYRPNWARFRELSDDWERRMKDLSPPGELANSKKRRNKQVSKPGQTKSRNCDVQSTSNETQTNQINQSKEPMGDLATTEHITTTEPQKISKAWKKASKISDEKFKNHYRPKGKHQVDRYQAGRAAARRRWEQEARNLDQDLYEALVHWITEKQAELATTAEMKARGTGLQFLLAEMRGS